MTIKTRLWTGFLIMLGCTVGACVFGRVLASSVAASTDAMADHSMVEALAARDAEAGMTQARLAAANFYLKPAAKLGEEVIAAARHASEALTAVADATNAPARATAAKDAVADVAAFQSLFQKVLDQYATRGFVETEGAQGKLRAAVHAIEKAVQDQKLPELTILLLQCRRHEKDYMLRKDDKYIAQIEDRIKEFEAQMAALNLAPDAQKPLMDLWAQYKGGVAALHDADAAIDAARGLLDAKAQEVIAAVTAVREQAVAEADAAKSSVLAALSAQRTTLTALLFFASVTGFAIAFVTTRSVTRPIGIVSGRMNEIARGDLTLRVELKSKDEMGLLAGNINSFVGNFADVVRTMAGVSSDVSAAATQLAASSEEMSKATESQRGETTRTSSAVAEMSSSVTEVARKAADAAQSAKASGDQATDGGRVVAQTLEQIKDIDRAVSTSVEIVTDLGRRGEQIGEIINVINDIAEQTNLLALNAAIEAARAGEHGRGFAVVADEVRKLADRTTKATTEVTSSITSIREQTDRAVGQIRSGSDCVRTSVESSRAAEQRLAAIVTSTAKLSGMMADIASAVEEQGAASNEISRAVDVIAGVANNTASAASEVSGAATTLSKQAEQLNELVHRFKY